MATAQTAKTQYVQAANGTKFAFRRLGNSSIVPLVMQIHFRANMDFWDPLLLNGLAAAREVIIFDQAGVGRSSGEVPTTFQHWADDLIAFVRALGLAHIDLLGFSMGGCAVQMVSLTAPKLVRKLILAGTCASIPSGNLRTPTTAYQREEAPSGPIKALATAVTLQEIKSSLAYSFFYDDNIGKTAANAYWNRLAERNVAGEPLVTDFVALNPGSKNQRTSFKDFMTPNPRNSFDRLGELKMSVLILNGDDDALIPTSRSWELAVNIKDSQLIIYPHAGHGFLYQYAELVAQNINQFLDGNDYILIWPKL